MIAYKGNERGDSQMVVHFIGVRDDQMTAANEFGVNQISGICITIGVHMVI